MTTVIGVMQALEINTDVALIGVNVYTTSTSSSTTSTANVAVIEVPAISGGAVAIED